MTIQTEGFQPKIWGVLAIQLISDSDSLSISNITDAIMSLYVASLLQLLYWYFNF